MTISHNCKAYFIPSYCLFCWTAQGAHCASRVLILTRWTALIRGFNSIYQQAPRLSASDYKDFTGYCLAWHRCVEQHHMHEEVNYFPEIERVRGQNGVMDGEVEQHGRN